MDLTEIDILRWVLVFIWIVYVWEEYMSHRQVCTTPFTYLKLNRRIIAHSISIDLWLYPPSD